MSYFALYQISNIKSFPKVMIKHHKNIEGRWWLIAIDIIDPKDEVEDSVVGDDVTALDEYD